MIKQDSDCAVPIAIFLSQNSSGCCVISWRHQLYDVQTSYSILRLWERPKQPLSRCIKYWNILLRLFTRLRGKGDRRSDRLCSSQGHMVLGVPKYFLQHCLKTTWHCDSQHFQSHVRVFWTTVSVYFRPIINCDSAGLKIWQCQKVPKLLEKRAVFFCNSPNHAVNSSIWNLPCVQLKQTLL